MDRGENRDTTLKQTNKPATSQSFFHPNFLSLTLTLHFSDARRRASEAPEPAHVMDVAVAAVEEEPKLAPQVWGFWPHLRATGSDFIGPMWAHLPLNSVVLLQQQQQVETIQDAVQSFGRVTRSVAANSPKLAPPSLFSVSKTPNKKIGIWKILLSENRL